jgi:hypothetical protein
MWTNGHNIVSVQNPNNTTVTAVLHVTEQGGAQNAPYQRLALSSAVSYPSELSTLL